MSGAEAQAVATQRDLAIRVLVSIYATECDPCKAHGLHPLQPMLDGVRNKPCIHVMARDGLKALGIDARSAEADLKAQQDRS